MSQTLLDINEGVVSMGFSDYRIMARKFMHQSFATTSWGGGGAWLQTIGALLMLSELWPENLMMSDFYRIILQNTIMNTPLEPLLLNLN